MGKLKVGIDGRAFVSPAAGIRRYVGGLVPALLRLGDLEIVVLGGPESVASSLALAYVREPPHPPSNPGWTLIGLPRAAARAGVDLIHAPAYTAPFRAGVPIVLTIHDVSYALHPEWYPYRRDWLRRTFYRLSARAASHVLTVSEFSAVEIMAAYGIDRARITVTPLGVDSAFRPADPALPCELPTGVQAPFLLHVGDMHERRNLTMVTEALIAARRRFGPAAALSLVLAGVDRGVGEALTALAARAGAADAVVRLGKVSEERLRTLYQCATALVYPSLYEGFGLPVLEAMASGTPVIVSKAASIPEVAGSAGILLDPTDVGGWTEAIVHLVNDEGLREKLRRDGLRRATAFTWERTAALTLEAYRRVA